MTPSLQRAGELVAARLRDLPDPRRLLQHLLRLLDDALADRRHRDLALAALEEPRAELLLELLDRDRQRRLAHEAALRGAAEAPLVRDGDDVAKLVQRHRRCRLAALAQERGEVVGQLRMLEPEIDRRLEVAELACRSRSGGPRTRRRARVSSASSRAMPSVSWISPPAPGGIVRR